MGRSETGGPRRMKLQWRYMCGRRHHLGSLPPRPHALTRRCRWISVRLGEGVAVTPEFPATKKSGPVDSESAPSIDVHSRTISYPSIPLLANLKISLGNCIWR
jgi:hypothetical protein